uniref:Small ribosomal subunit protein uS8c n=1 Tax=Microrhizoidea pickettheapsiorum TaxID=2604950 RepID=A0A5B9RUC2_9CHLO|nr:ribosomal protein S8 [Microrhizoidea pickettheapsiorum]QEG77707.1 ribosomal protein S8 [Microrhizoidea pickettheapsiorum]
MSYMATCLRNAIQVKHQKVELKSTNLLKNIASILKEEGFIDDFRLMENSNLLSINLKYIGKNQKPCLTQIKTMSKPSLRMYASSQNLPKVLGGLGIAIISTSQGLLTEKEAKNRGVGGEVLCYVW